MSNPTRRHASHSPNPDDEEIDLMQLMGVLWFHKWRIGLITILITALGIGYALIATPIYQANGMVEFTNNKNQVLGDLSEIVGAQKTPADSEVDMIKSRRVLGKTVDDLRLAIEITPKISYWTRLMQAFNHQNDVKPMVDVDTFRLPETLLDEPFTFIAKNTKEYQLITPEKQTLSGKVGQPLNIGKDGQLLVSRIAAPNGQVFVLTHYSKLNSIDHIQQDLTVAPKNKNSPMIGLNLSGADPVKIKQILDSIMQNYAAESRNKDVQAASSGLRFISEELPRLQHALQEAENALNQYRSRSRSLDVPQEAKGVLESLNKIEMQLIDFKTERAVMSEVYTHEHPALRALDEKIRVLNESKTKLNQQITQMPALQQDIIRLTRNVDINQAIYVQLLGKQQELQILKASSQGKVRIIDAAATPKQPVKPKKAIVVLLAMVLGLFLSAGYYVLKSLFNQGINGEDEIEALGLEVIASIPMSDAQQKRDRITKKISKNKHVRSNSMLALRDPTDVSVEALRALRTNLFFSTMSAKNNIIMISGATPEVGKSFVAANLAVLMAQSGKKVLLIDGDMRKGYMHHLLEMPSSEGFAEILLGENQYYQHIWQTNLSDLHFLSGGNTPKNPSELLLSSRLEAFLTWAGEHYDYVILDTPPVLAVTDAAVMGQYVGMTLLVTRFAQTSLRELDACVSRFQAGSVAISGIILNGIERVANNYYSYDAYADKYGKYQQADRKNVSIKTSFKNNS